MDQAVYDREVVLPQVLARTVCCIFESSVGYPQENGVGAAAVQKVGKQREADTNHLAQGPGAEDDCQPAAPKRDKVIMLMSVDLISRKLIALPSVYIRLYWTKPQVCEVWQL